MPFLVKLMQNADRVAAYSFVHSMATTLGASIYEKTSKILVQDSAREAYTKFNLKGVISHAQAIAINNIIEELKDNKSPRSSDIVSEKHEVIAASAGEASRHGDEEEVDFHYVTADGIKRYIEIKTAKPNMQIFAASKRKLLRWVARKREEDMEVFLAIPYNPYHPKPYSRFTQKDLFQTGKDLLVGEQYWDLLNGESGTLESLLTIFDQVGKEYKERIDEKIREVSGGNKNIL